MDPLVYVPRLLLFLDPLTLPEDPDLPPGFGELPVPGAAYELSDFAEQEQMAWNWVQWLVRKLEEEGYITRSTAPGHMYALTEKGQDEARRLRVLHTDLAARVRSTNDAFLRWMFEHPGGHRDQFARSPESWFAGDELTVLDLGTAADYLVDRGLLEPMDETASFRITANGIDCVLSGSSVSDYLSRSGTKVGVGPAQTPMGDVYHVHQPQGGIIGGRHNNVSQGNSVALSPELLGQLSQLAAMVRLVAPVLELPDEKRQQLADQAQELANEAGAPRPEAGRVRQTLDKLRGGIAAAAQVTAAVTLLAVEADQLIQAVAPMP